MKKIAFILLFSAAIIGVAALDWTYSTSQFSGYNYVTNVYAGTNSADTNRDSYIVAWNKLNHNDNWLAQTARLIASNSWSILAATNGLTTGDARLTSSNGVPVVVTFSNGVVGVFNLTGVGSGGSTNTTYITNIITAYNLSNAWLGSQRIMTFATNNAAWGASNYLARVNGLHSWNLYGGNDGGNPPGDIPMKLVGSYTGTNGWFTITNGFTTTNTISIAALTNGYSYSGGTRVTLGGATLYSIDNWPLLGRTNYGFGQFYRFNEPVDFSDAATKNYVDTGLANVTDRNFTTALDTNTMTAHLIYQRSSATIFDIASRTAYVPIKGVSLSGTNILLEIYQTNLTAGWYIESTTNLALVNSWVMWTNYSLATNTGVVTFTTPILPSEPQRFYRGRGNSTNSVSVNAPFILPITTPASSTASTFGNGAGVVLVDTNYIYVSVGTNQWKRAALSSW